MKQLGSSSWQPSSQPIDSESLDRELATNDFTVIHFWASWNNIDKLMDVEIQKLQSVFKGRIRFRSLDTAQSEVLDFCKSCRVLNLPALGLFRGCKHVDTLNGLRKRGELLKFLERWVGESA